MLVLGIVAFLGGVLLFVGDARERSSRNRKEQASLQRECDSLMARLAAVESHIPQALVRMDSRGLIRGMNLAAESLFG